MPVFKQVGKSSVTPIKHGLLYRMLSRHAGVLSSGKAPIANEVWIDLTAGDGVAYEGQPFNYGCSPGILHWHACYTPRYGKRVPVQVVLNEWKGETFARLKGSLKDRLVEIPSWVTLSNADAKTLDLSRFGVNKNDSDLGVFLYNDPNAITGWVLTDELLDQCPKFTCTLSTLGCNPAGLKRISSEIRSTEWVEKIDSVKAIVRNWHDVGLFLVGDASQWAYLVTTPQVWRRQIEQEWKTLLKTWGQSVSKRKDENSAFAWYKENPRMFELLKQKLVMTNAEFEEYQKKEASLSDWQPIHNQGSLFYET